MSKFFTISYYILAAALLLLGVVLMGSMVPTPGNFQLKVVQSGSMEPAIPTGSLIAVRPDGPYEINDVITFGADTKTQIPTTHRIIAMTMEDGQLSFITKGDANEEADPTPVMAKEVIGQVAFSIPKAGFVMDFARQPLGTLLLIVIPALALIIDELFTIVREVRKGIAKKVSDGISQGLSHGARAGTVVAQTVALHSAHPSAPRLPNITQPVLLRNRSRKLRVIPQIDFPRTPVIPDELPVDGIIRQKRLARVFGPRSIDGIARGPAFASLFLMIALGIGAFSGTASADYNDTEISTGNIFAAGLLDFTAEIDDPNLGLMCGGDEKTVTVTLALVEGSREITHSAYAEFAGGNADLCEAAEVTARYEGDEKYEGDLLDFNVGNFELPGQWEFDIALPAGANNIPDGATCDVALVFAGFCPLAPDFEGSGWNDEERVILTIEKKPLPDCPTCGGDVDVTIINNNNSTVTNNASSSANTGGNSANGGDGGGDGGDGGDGGTIVSGDATSTVTIENIINQNITEVSTGGCNQCSPCGNACENHEENEEEDEYQHENNQSTTTDSQSSGSTATDLINSVKDKLKNKLGDLFGH